MIKSVARQVEIKFTAKDIERVPISSLHLWKDNPRANDEAAPKLAKLIAAHGQRTPVVAWRKNRVVYKGNTTLKAMRSLEMKEIAVLWADFPSEQAAIAYGIADNKSSEFAEWDEDILNRLLSSQQLDDTGFSESEIRGHAMLPDIATIDKINAENVGLKDKIIVLVLDAAKKGEVKELLKTWIASSGLKDIEVK
jgi:hypothetical protein